jgi:ribose/xylose/arabinose/galactoside ABC-type transport system permease subunit
LLTDKRELINSLRKWKLLNNVNSNIQLVTKGLLVVGAVALQQLRPRNID